ncbi:hypothetical protein C9890_0407 [Perkinsus sp. BL_2016]|nr:hypothetical protein C9890_0407 [Perkinsus sp. BL_2016]
MPLESYPHAIRCSHRAFDGSVYVLRRGLIFVVKPVVFVPWTDVQAVELMRASAAMGGRFFDLRVFVKGGAVMDFQQIDRGVYASLVAELQNLGVKIRNLQVGLPAASAATPGVVGNGTYGALISNQGKVVWCSMEGFSGDPIFNALVNVDSVESGFFAIELSDILRTEQKYIPNTAVLITTLISTNNDVIQIKDFAPKFINYDRLFRPFQLFRTVTRIRGDPLIRIRIKPSFEYNASDGYTTRGSHHLRFCGNETVWRLTTSYSVKAIIEESVCLVHDPVYFVFGQDESFTGSLSHVCKEFEDKTVRYWKNKVNTLALPVDYQDIIIRNIVTLSLLQSEESGGILASLTLGIPNAQMGLATRDRRVCELLDTCLSLPVLRELGMFAFIKKFIEFVKNVSFNTQLAAICGDLGNRLHQELPLEYLAGFKGGNTHGGSLVAGMRNSLEDDISVLSLLVIALTHGFFDARMKDVCSPKLFERLEKIGDRILNVLITTGLDGSLASNSKVVIEYFEDSPRYYCSDEPATPCTGKWVFGQVLMWAALDRLQRVAESMNLVEKAKGWNNHATQLREEIFHIGISSSKRCFVSFQGSTHTGPSLLRLAELGFISDKDPIFIATVEEYERHKGAHNQGAVMASTLMWYGEALRSIGRVKDAQNLFHAMCAVSSETGLLTESVDLKTGTLWGNGPSANAILAFLRLGTRLSRNWRSV